MNKYFSINLLTVLLMMGFQLSYGQQNIRVTGKVVNKNDQSGVPFVHLLIESTGTGAISNLYGDFTLDYSSKHQNKNLIISSLGYKSKSIPLANLRQSPVEIVLEEDVVQLEEVVVRPEDPVELLKEAFRRIPENYDTMCYKLLGYYKTSTELMDKNVKYTEAFIDTYKPRYTGFLPANAHHHDSILVKQVRTKPSEFEDWKLESMLAWEGSIHSIELRDLVEDFRKGKGRFELFLSKNTFEIQKRIKINGRNTYMIKLEPQKRKGGRWKGFIYLDEETKAFVKLDVLSTPILFRKIRSSMNYIIISKLYNVFYKKGEWKESISYKKVGDKWYFNEITASKVFVISSKKRNIENEPVNVNLLYSTNQIEKNVVMPDTARFLPIHNIDFWGLKKFLDDRYQPTFWEEYDRKTGASKDSAFALKEDVAMPETTYKFTKLDTLQGALTPLRTCFDVGFYHLNVELFPEEEQVKGSSLIRFRATENTQRIQIDLYDKMSVDSIAHRGQLLSFKREFNAVYVDFPQEVRKGAIEDIKVYFSGRPVDYNPNIPMYGSFIWAEDINGNPWLQAICQGYGASGWWPNKDHLSDEPDSAMISVTVPAGLEVVSNGRLRSKQNLNGNKTRFDWSVSYPINNYNLILNVGKYEHMDSKYTNGTSNIDLDYYVMKHQSESAKEKVKIVQPMLATYEKYFGPYPFPNDGFKLVSSLHPMEHQSCVSIDADYFDDSDEVSMELKKRNLSNGRADFSIVLHESAHEWWGNSVSCTDNAELWIHEAFATYAESLYIEDHYGYEIAQNYINAMKNHVFNQDPILGKMNVNHIHYEIQDMYTKGALMLNTLRHTINNDSLWFSILKGIQQKFKYQSITTDQVIQYFNNATQTDYTSFFDQYLKHTTIPQLQVAFEERESKTFVKYRWVADAKSFNMPIRFSVGQENTEFLYPTKDWQSTELSTTPDNFRVDTESSYITVDRMP